MKNKIELKKYLKLTLITSLILIILFIFINKYEYKKYTLNYNNKISSLITLIKEKYNNIEEKEIIEALNNETKTNDTLLKYGIDITKDSVIKENETNFTKFLILNVSFLILSLTLLLILFLKHNSKMNKELKEITSYLHELNNQNYKLELSSMTEDELSILKNEIYKTTIMLKESSINSKKDKINLKKALEDISHQLKTPLTSILIILDDLYDDNDMFIDTRNEFIRDIKREIININFLINTLLKLSKFDSNTITFKKEITSLEDIINESTKNVLALCDLKNVKINIKHDKNIKLLCDKKWEIEAITNIIKNCIEHTEPGGQIDVSYINNNVYTTLTIKDNGEYINEKDIKHIFERFYNSSTQKAESTGIGLSLSKSIIEKDNGKIYVESTKEETKFTIKYFK